MSGRSGRRRGCVPGYFPFADVYRVQGEFRAGQICGDDLPRGFPDPGGGESAVCADVGPGPADRRAATPEYVGARQKRFAWIIGLVLAATMFVFLVVVNAFSPITGITCLICLLFLYFEAVFGICLGCKFYPLFFKEKVQYCPGRSVSGGRDSPSRRRRESSCW